MNYITIGGRKILYVLTRRRGMKNIRMRIDADGTISASAPYGVPKETIENVIRKNFALLNESRENLDEDHQRWEKFVQKRMSGIPKNQIRKYGENFVAGTPFREGSIFDGLPLITTKQEFQDLFYRACERFTREHKIQVNGVTLRHMTSRWGSCRPTTGKMTFNLLLFYVPRECAEYVIYHELCHYLELNHSRRFWAQVERYVPNYRDIEKMMKGYGEILIGHRMPDTENFKFLS